MSWRGTFFFFSLAKRALELSLSLSLPVTLNFSHSQPISGGGGGCAGGCSTGRGGLRLVAVRVRGMCGGMYVVCECYGRGQGSGSKIKGAPCCGQSRPRTVLSKRPENSTIVEGTQDEKGSKGEKGTKGGGEAQRQIGKVQRK